MENFTTRGILTRCVRGQGNAQKRATLACHSECLHNGIILIVYILQICCCKGSAFFWNIKIISCKFAYFLFFLYFCSRIVHWNPNKTTTPVPYLIITESCISFKLFIEILIKQHATFRNYNLPVVYILQIVHWNPDKTTNWSTCSSCRELCISFKLFIEILIKQLPITLARNVWGCVYPSNCSLKSW